MTDYRALVNMFNLAEIEFTEDSADNSIRINKQSVAFYFDENDNLLYIQHIEHT